MHSYLFKCTLVLNSVLFWKLFVFEFLLGISETFLCSISDTHVKIVVCRNVDVFGAKNVLLNHIL
jgi:hypothetical protein